MRERERVGKPPVIFMAYFTVRVYVFFCVISSINRENEDMNNKCAVVCNVQKKGKLRLFPVQKLLKLINTRCINYTFKPISALQNE